MTRLWMSALLVLISIMCFSQPVKDSSKTTTKPTAEKKWFETVSVRGYVQIRYNRLLETNPDLGNEQGDRSWGKNGGFFMRRARIIFFGQISKQVYFYFQPDFASSASSTSLHFGQIRDAYIDLGVDVKNEFRFRIGQSKIPYGFENMQSSQNRLPLDRNDALNSAVANERDMGVFFYWAPTKQRELFSSLVRDGLKGSGDYGVFALGAYNGQTANRPEQNDRLHVVTRLTYPMAVGNQIIEPSIQAYTGKYVVTRDQTNIGTKVKQDRNYLDQRLAGTFVLYPKPFGILAEYTIGKGPEFNPATDSIETRSLHGGYVTLSYMMKNKQQQIFIPFIRGQYYNGGKKHEQDARRHRVKELEIGIEWQPVKQFELVAMYTISSRRYEDFALQNNLQKGSLLRLQAQLNF
ncbi:porin [Sediminibacterium goheungense]|uniref:Phosphate-selective porin O/P n=1 Tax=Sediminibacterium goheungense TaxID=1086393 RepID=A0A4R6J129_9BACT|nr:porin [Sediminibacterium goheungense]TDO28904.1 phosphate-selective porin O/P [Sediminibacterium goheungense]